LTKNPFYVVFWTMEDPNHAVESAQGREVTSVAGAAERPCMYKNEVRVFLVCCGLYMVFFHLKEWPVDETELGRWIAGALVGCLISYFMVVRAVIIISLRLIRGKHWLGRPFPMSLLGMIAIPAFLVFYGRMTRGMAVSEIQGQAIISVIFWIAFALIGASYLNFVLRLKP
jgi:hypothetical protein